MTQGLADNEWKIETTYHGGTAGLYVGRFTASLKTPRDGADDALLIASAPTIKAERDAMLSLLKDASEVLKDYEDADHNGSSYVPNAAMRLKTEIDELITKVGG